MNKHGLIFIILSLIVVLCMAFIAFPPETDSLSDTTITVINSGTVISAETEKTTAEKLTEKTNPKTTATAVTKLQKTAKTTTTTTTIATEATAKTEEIIIEEVIAEEIPLDIPEVIFIDINTADIEELMLLDGVGEVTARAIIAYREEYGGFRNIEEIMNVNGIGEVKFAQIRDFIFVENPVYFFEEEITENPEPSDVIYQPVMEVPPEIPSAEETPTAVTLESLVPIDINTADIEILMFLPYVDEETARAIITLREDIGGFSHVYELLYIDNLTQKQVAELTEFVTVGE